MRFGAGNRGWTIQSCYFFCGNKGFLYFGMQSYFECYCDDSLNHTTQYGSSSCGTTGGSLCNYVYAIVDYPNMTLVEYITVPCEIFQKK